MSHITPQGNWHITPKEILLGSTILLTPTLALMLLVPDKKPERER